MARKGYVYKGVTYDSNEEIEFLQWLEEAQMLGMVQKWIYQPKSFELCSKVTVDEMIQLKTKKKAVQRSLLQSHKYTADFKIWFTEDINKFNTELKNLNLLYNRLIYIDIKGGFNSRGSHSNFSVESKWVWDKYKILVEKVIPEKFFKATWVPELVRITPKRHEIKKKYDKGFKTFENIAELILNENK